jgi:hypothetical protein
MPTRIYTPEELDAIGVPFECDVNTDDGYAAELHQAQVDTRRWVSVHELVFRAPDDGKTYRVRYEQGLTDNQDDHDPWDYKKAIKATEVELRPVTVERWFPVEENA